MCNYCEAIYVKNPKSGQAEVIMKNTPCYCLAYHFPHRPGGGSCKVPQLVRELEARGYTITRRLAYEYSVAHDDYVDAANEFVADSVLVDDRAEQLVRY